jgi:hypothetical protein
MNNKGSTAKREYVSGTDAPIKMQEKQKTEELFLLVCNTMQSV